MKLRQFLHHSTTSSPSPPLEERAGERRPFSHQRPRRNSGHALLMVLVMLGVALIIMGGLYSYSALNAYKNTARILSNARKKNSLDGVVGSVYQDIELTQIPIFQYAVFYNVVLEFTPLPNMTITGPVHCNTNIYNNPQGTLTYKSDVSSSGTIVEGRNPISPMPALRGPVVCGLR